MGGLAMPAAWTGIRSSSPVPSVRYAITRAHSKSPTKHELPHGGCCSRIYSWSSIPEVSFRRRFRRRSVGRSPTLWSSAFDPVSLSRDPSANSAASECLMTLHRLLACNVILIAAVAIGILCWPMMSGAQMVGPTPQPQGIPVTPEQAEQVEQENWAIHGQATNVWLVQPAFRSPYRGTQSLRAGANGRETVDVTVYAGIRPWPGAEIWINPEVDQGFGLSDTFGVAGYVSGEAYKVGKAQPYFLVQRGFLRQTINLGGETEKLDPGLNQLGGTQTSDRLVLSVGKYSVVDIFDTNVYAHDPRNDFFNWSIIDMGAFDYAANAWGYTYGAAGEWYQDWWAVRAGVFAICRKRRTRSRCPTASARGNSWPSWRRGIRCGTSPAGSSSCIG